MPAPGLVVGWSDGRAGALLYAAGLVLAPGEYF